MVTPAYVRQFVMDMLEGWYTVSHGKAESDGQLLFAFELVYAGVFRIQNIPQENVHPIVMIECPRLLFPFAREIIAAAVRNGGYPPLMIDPVDFVGLYRQKMGDIQPPQPQAFA